MIELFLTGVGILGIVVIWRFMWRSLALDLARDKLFDLRDEHLRDFFLQNGYGLDNSMYPKLRTLVNGHLRHTESITLWEVVYAVTKFIQNPSFDNHFKELINAEFFTEDLKMKEFIENFRLTSSSIVFDYMIHTSVAGMLFLGLLFVVGAISKMFVTSSKIVNLVTSPAKTSSLTMEVFALN